MTKTMREELEKWWGSVLEVTPDDIKSDTIKVVSDKDIERLLQSVFEEIVLTYKNSDPDDDGDFLKKLKQPKNKYCNSELEVKEKI